MPYSDPQNLVLLHVRQIGVGSDRSSTVTPATVSYYQQFADSFINGRLSSIYVMPLLQLNRPSLSGLSYPDPIPEIARRLTASYLVLDVFTEIEPNVTSNAQAQMAIAENELQKISNPDYFLEGQIRKPRNPGSNPFTEPASYPNVQHQPVVKVP